MGIKILFLRWKYTPNPLSCRWCGFPEKGHDVSYLPAREPNVHPHEYTMPTHAQVQARMQAARTEARVLPEKQYKESLEESTRTLNPI